MAGLVFLELGIAAVLIIGVWGWLRWHRPRDDEDTP